MSTREATVAAAYEIRDHMIRYPWTAENPCWAMEIGVGKVNGALCVIIAVDQSKGYCSRSSVPNYYIMKGYYDSRGISVRDKSGWSITDYECLWRAQ
jgi:hypothetical protein